MDHRGNFTLSCLRRILPKLPSHAEAIVVARIPDRDQDLSCSHHHHLSGQLETEHIEWDCQSVQHYEGFNDLDT